jgi:probable HAF family extracellular repeat protein
MSRASSLWRSGLAALAIAACAGVFAAPASARTFYQATRASRSASNDLWNLFLNPQAEVVSTDDGAEALGPEAFLYVQGRQRLARPPACVPDTCFSQASSINGSGQISGWLMAQSDRFADRAYRFDVRTGSLRKLRLHSEAYSVNPARQLVGGYRDNEGQERAFLWTGTSFRDLGTLGGAQAVATASAHRGRAVGCAQTASGSWHPFLYRDGKMHDLGLPPGLANACAYSTNNGHIVGGDDVGPWTSKPSFVTFVGVHACIAWNRSITGRYTIITPPPGISCLIARHVDRRGVVALTGGYHNGVNTAYTWSAGRLHAMVPAAVPFGDDLQNLAGGVPFLSSVEGTNLHGQAVVLGADSQVGALLTPLRIYDEGSSALRYRGSWTRVPETGAWRGRVNVAAHDGASVTLSFTGSSVSVIGPKGPLLGPASVYLDGSAAGTIHERGSAAERQRLFQASFSVRGAHVLRIVAHAGFELDALTTTQQHG